MFYQAPMVKRIRIVYERATDDQLERGLAWYADARSWCIGRGRKHGYTLKQVAGAVAALSPNRSWETNLMLAERALAAHKAGLDHEFVKLSFTRDNRRVWAILDGASPLDVLGGPKVRAFYRNLVGDYSAVTIDRWAYRVARWDDYKSGFAHPRYGWVADAYRQAADELGIEPAELQAITWVTAREAK